MRTTVTLAPDVAAGLDRLRRDQGIGMSEAINQLVRAGLNAGGTGREVFVQKASDMGAPLIPLDDVQAALDALEGDGRRA